MERKTKFTREMRLKIVEEYENSALTGLEIAQKYGIKNPSLICNWRTRLFEKSSDLENDKKNVTFASTNDSSTLYSDAMKNQTPEELEAENKRLQKELELAQLQNKALNTLINIAERQGIQIRKKSGAKQ